jgi:hypothetical protein
MGTIGMDPATIRSMGDLAEGMVGVSPIRSWDEVDHPGIKKVEEEFELHGRNKEKSLVYLSIFAMGQAGVEVIGRAIDEVGLENLDGGAIKEAMEKTEDFRPLDLTIMTMLPGKRSPSYARIMEVRGGKILPLTEFRICPDMRPS